MNGQVIQEIEKEPAAPGGNSDMTSLMTIERVFWGKKNYFWPLPLALDHEEQPLSVLDLQRIAMNLFFCQEKGDPIANEEYFQKLDGGMKLLTTFVPAISVCIDRYFSS